MVRLSQHIPTSMRILRLEKFAGTNFSGKKFSWIFADLPKIREIPENFFPGKFLPAKISAFKVVVLRREQRSKEERCCQCKMNPITQEIRMGWKSEGNILVHPFLVNTHGVLSTTTWWSKMEQIS